MSSFPLTYMGDGRFECHGYHARRLPYGQGEIITVEEVQERSLKSHAHYFASITEAWRTLPETIADDFPNAESLRKWALIRAGYCTETKMAFRTNADAVTAAALFGKTDGYAICQVTDRLLTVWQAESQSMKAMRKVRFNQSKEAVLRVISELIDADASKASEAA